MKLKITYLIICFFVFSNCGFKVVNLDTNFNITEIITSGDKRINYKLKKKILGSSKENSEDQVTVLINSKKEKTVKEKNLSNQITKYEIRIIIDIEYKSLKIGEEGKFSLSKTGDYSVSTRFSDTLNNEKNLVNSLVNSLADEILENLISNLNDL
tara:strand:+ start:650 stop:1114 length:465 start_codon:yes stop_codon:yes gene_type:complete